LSTGATIVTPEVSSRRAMHVKAPQACRKELAELIDANDRRLGASRSRRGSRLAPGCTELNRWTSRPGNRARRAIGRCARPADTRFDAPRRYGL